MELIHINSAGDTYRLVYRSESSLRYFGNGRSVFGGSLLDKYWPRITTLTLYVNENLIGETKAKQDSRDPDNKDYGMWVCTKKMLVPLAISKQDKAAIWEEFKKSTCLLTPNQPAHGTDKA